MPGPDNCQIPGIIAQAAFLLVGGVMLLVDDDQS